MSNRCLLAIYLALQPLGLLAQAQPSPAPRRPIPKSVSAPTVKPIATPAKSRGLTVDNVLEMVRAGLSEDLIIARIRKEDKATDLTPEEMISLKKAGASDAILKVLLDPKTDLKPLAPATLPTATPAGAATTNAAPAAQPIVVVGAAMPAITTPKPSGATPGPGTADSTSFDPNDPSQPHESGIYLYTKDRDGKPLMTVLERASYQGAKTGGFFTSALTYGIKKVKSRAVIPGPKASIRISEASPTFYFYFEDKAAGLGKTYFGIAALSNPNQFALLRLEVKKNNRETIVGEMNAFGSSSGSDAKSMLTFKSERLRPGLYKVTVSEPMEPGEYCFLASSGMMGAPMAGAASAADIFDFSIGPTQ